MAVYAVSACSVWAVICPARYAGLFLYSLSFTACVSCLLSFMVFVLNSFPGVSLSCALSNPLANRMMCCAAGRMLSRSSRSCWMRSSMPFFTFVLSCWCLCVVC